MNVGNYVIFKTPTSIIIGKICNIDEFRPANMIYTIDVIAFAGDEPDDDVVFAGDHNIVPLITY